MGLQELHWTDDTPFRMDDRVELTVMGKLALLTARQRQTLQAIVTYHRHFGYYPSFREMAVMVGVNVSTVFWFWSALERKGFVERRGMQPRAMRIFLGDDDLASDPTFLDALANGQDRLARDLLLQKTRRSLGPARR